MKNKFSLVLLSVTLLIITITGCDKKEEASHLITIPVDANNSEIGSFDALAEDIEVIKLESSPKSLIGNVDKIIIEDSLIFIQDEMKGKGIYCFNLNGDFLFKIGAVGRGPGEFSLPGDFIVDGEGISVFDYDTKRKINYNLQGEFINENPVQVRVMNVHKFSSDTLFIRPRVYSQNNIDDGYNLIITNGDLSKVYSTYLKGLNRIENIAFPEVFWKYNDHMLYTYGYNDTIYKYSNSILWPYIFIDFKGNKMPQKIFERGNIKDSYSEFSNSKKNYASRLYRLVENENFLTMNYVHRKLTKLIVYSKSSNQYKNLEKLRSNQLDLDINFPQTAYKGKFVSVAEQGMDNPLLLIYNIKDF